MTLYLSENRGNDNEIVARMNSAKEKDFGHNLRKYLREYSEVTGIHGLRYATEKRSRVEKIVWIFLLLLSLAGCLYMIYEILDKYNNSPVVVSFATEDTPLYQIPFPAITICPESKYDRDLLFNYTKVYFQLSNNEKVDEDEMKTFDHLSLLCEAEKMIMNYTNKTVDNRFFETIHDLRILQPLMLPLCLFNNKAFICEDSFIPIIIDQGICYSFNILGREEVFKKHVYHFKNYYNVPNKSENFYDIETGYKKNVGVNTYPRRALTSGADNAFTIMFRYDKGNTDFTCNMFLQGFRVLIHNPWDVPRLSKHYFRIPLHKVVVAAMTPEMVVTSEAVRKFKPEKRKCFMRDERPLKHFNYYSQSNCMLECITNYTLKKCGCVRFFMPRDNVTAICGMGNGKCVDDTENELKLRELEAKMSGHDFCECRPACTNIQFNVETSHSDFYFKEYFDIHKQLKFDNNTNARWSVLQLYFKDEQFVTTERNELYGISDLISNFGGLLGLFTGFSLISGLEIIYFCSLRIYYNERLYGIWSGPPTN